MSSMERTETGYRLRCVCGRPDCEETIDVAVFPRQDVVVVEVAPGVELPFCLSDLRRALNEAAP